MSDATDTRPSSTAAVRASIAGNVAQWTRVNREYGDASAEEAWNAEHITWGQFGIRDEDIGSPLGDVAGKDILELGCGVAYFSAWLARRGARPVGVDPTPAQLATARRLQAKTGIEFPLIEGAGEHVPLPDDSLSTSSCPSTARRCGPTPTCGSPRRRACCDRAAGWCS